MAFRLLSRGEWPLVASLEQAAWPPSLQADGTTIQERFALGHSMMGAWQEGNLVGLLAYTLTSADPHDERRFPATFTEFSSLPRTDPPRAAYAYNLCVHPAFRRLNLTVPLIRRVRAHTTEHGSRYLVGDGRCPSYRGSIDPRDRTRENPRFRQVIEDWKRTGRRPADSELILDPVLRFYWRTTRCRFLHLRPDFLPADIASGGFRVIFAIDLTRDRGPE